MYSWLSSISLEYNNNTRREANISVSRKIMLFLFLKQTRSTIFYPSSSCLSKHIHCVIQDLQTFKHKQTSPLLPRKQQSYNSTLMTGDLLLIFFIPTPFSKFCYWLCLSDILIMPVNKSYLLNINTLLTDINNLNC